MTKKSSFELIDIVSDFEINRIGRLEKVIMFRLISEYT